jgi:hypothetical protein
MKLKLDILGIKPIIILSLVFFSFQFAVLPIKAQISHNISGIVFEDLNTNQSLDIAEQGLSNVNLRLIKDGKIIANTVSDENGYYYFVDLTEGQYQVKVNLSGDWVTVGSDFFDVDLSQNDQVTNIPAYQLINLNPSYGPIMNISDVAVSKVNADSVKIEWFTNYLATSQVVIDKISKSGNTLKLEKSFGYQIVSPTDFQVALAHSVTVTGLEPNTLYYYRVVSLPNPNQWHGASFILSNEFTFSTSPNPNIENNPETSKTNEPAEVEVKNLNPKTTIAEQEVLSAKTQEPTITVDDTKNNSQVTVNGAAIEELNNLKENCPVYIWILVVLNLLTIIYIRRQGQRVDNKMVQKLWWIMAILTYGPVILGYPQCWLSAWLIIILIINGYILTGFKKKKLKDPSFFGPSGEGMPTLEKPLKPKIDEDSLFPPPDDDLPT